MLQIEATVIPLSVQTDAGEVTAGEGETPKPAVIQHLITENGVVTVILPLEHVEDIVTGLLKAKESSETQKPKADIYIPKSTEEVSQVAQAHDKIYKGKV